MTDNILIEISLHTLRIEMFCYAFAIACGVIAILYIANKVLNYTIGQNF